MSLPSALAFDTGVNGTSYDGPNMVSLELPVSRAFHGHDLTRLAIHKHGRLL